MHRAEQGPVGVVAVPSQQQIAFDEPLGLRARRHKSNLSALAIQPEVNHALTAPQILYFQGVQFFPPHAVIEQRGNNRPIALDPLTVADDANFLTDIANQPNLPESIRTGLADLY